MESPPPPSPPDADRNDKPAQAAQVPARVSGQAGADPAAMPRLTILAQYVKDLSFENPHAPMPQAGPPAIDVQVDVHARRLRDSDFDVTLQIGATARFEEKIAFAAELVYGGLFRIDGVAEEAMESVVLVECPRQLFPFARRILADVTRDGGFPPLMLEPIDFLRLHRERAAAGRTDAPSVPPSSS